MQVSLSHRQHFDPESVTQLRVAAIRCAEAGLELEAVGLSDAMLLEAQLLRLGRRLRLPQMGRDAPAPPVDLLEAEPEIAAEVGRWRDDAEAAVALLASMPVQQAADLLSWIAAEEDRLYALNLIQPYRDVLPKIVQAAEPGWLGRVLAALPASVAARILLGDYTRLEDETIARVLAHMAAPDRLRVVQAMRAGRDWPRRMAGVLAACPREALDILESPVGEALALTALTQAEDPAARDRLHQKLPDRLRARTLEPPVSLHTAEGALDPVYDFSASVADRRAEPLAAGRSVCIEEWLETPAGRKPVRIDLLELPVARVSLRAHIRSEGRPDIEAARELFAPYLDGSARPSNEVFAAAGLFQLQAEVTRLGADFGLNGNFYFDFGHLVNARILGIPLDHRSGLRFGDPVGWMVMDGREVCPPAFNRGALVVCSDGRVLLDRVRIRACRVGDRLLRWTAENSPAPPADEVVFYNSLAGIATPAAPEGVAVSVANGRVLGRTEGAPIPIPFTGYALLVPRRHWAAEALLPGTPVESVHDLPLPEGVTVSQAMACGPLLVRDRQVVSSFSAEEFGRKDSTVMSFFLPRLFDAYEAARSFVLLRGEQILLGTVSGRAMGAGQSGLRAGLTFGELATLAVDLGAEAALGLDGGGSSSLVARRDGAVTLLNCPTGGADVPPGTERFISTALVGTWRPSQGE